MVVNGDGDEGDDDGDNDIKKHPKECNDEHEDKYPQYDVAKKHENSWTFNTFNFQEYCPNPDTGPPIDPMFPKVS